MVVASLERKRPVGSQVFVPGSQGAASGFESEKCRQMKRGDKAVHSCPQLSTRLLPQTGEAKTMGSSRLKVCVGVLCSWWLWPSVIEAK